MRNWAIPSCSSTCWCPQGNKPTGSRGPCPRIHHHVADHQAQQGTAAFRNRHGPRTRFRGGRHSLRPGGGGLAVISAAVEKSLRAAYDQLAASEQGAVDYFKLHANGRETLVPQEVHRQLEPEQQGSVRYYRIERPRLAELEVWAEGDEILTGALDRGGFGTGFPDSVN